MLRSSRRFLSYSFSILYVCTTKVLCPADGCPPFVERCRSSSPCCRIFSLKVKKEIDGSSSTGQTHIVFIRVAVRVIFIQTHKTHTKHILLFFCFLFFSFPAILSSVRLHAQRDRCGCLDAERREETLHFFSEKKRKKHVQHPKSNSIIIQICVARNML